MVQWPRHTDGERGGDRPLTRSIDARGATAFFLAGLIVGIGFAGSFTRESAPAWTASAALIAPRAYPQGVALGNGKVLITGGMDRVDGIVMRDHAEVFDLATGTSQRIDERRVGRMWATATTQRDDGVLVAGGVERIRDGYRTLRTAEIFDPWTLRWRNAGQMNEPRSDHGAVRLADGRTLVVGGHDGPRILRSVEAYDPRTNTWAFVAPLPLARWTFSIAGLPNGKVLVAGGFMEPGTATDSSLLYDPPTDSWTNGPPLALETANHTTVQLANGDVLLMGGQRAASGLAERYDWRRGQFFYAGTLNDPRMFAQSAVRDDGRVVLIGGILRPNSGGDGFIPNAFAEEWDPRTNLWSRIAAAPTARAGALIVTTAGSTCLFGGSASDDIPLGSIDCLR